VAIPVRAKAGIPSCCIASRYVSGYAAPSWGGGLGRDTLVRQRERPHCSFEGRTLPEWGLVRKEVAGGSTRSTIDEELSRLKRELKQAQEDLARQNTESRCSRH